MKTQLVITDEVNCKFLNLDVGTRNFLVKKFKYVDPRARHMAAVKLGRWDGATKYFQLGGSTYINLLPEILPILIERGYEIEIIDKRDYERSFSFEPITESQYSHLQWNDDFEQVGKPIMIRDYQVPLINTFLDNTQSIQEIATGAGKSIMTAALSDAVSKLGRSIVIVPNTDLVHNTVKYYKALGLECGVYHGDKKEWGMHHTICTWQSLNVLLKNSIDGENEPDKSITDFLDGVVCVIVDECFSGDSLVLTPNGYIPIKDINSGDTVINYSEDTKEFKEDVVVKKHINLTNSHSEKMYELEFDNGVKIKVTGNHKFLTNLGWCRADELTYNHDIIFKE